MGIIINILVGALAVFVSSYILPGVQVDGFVTAIVVAVVLGVINAFVKPIIQIVSLPITILTFGLFSVIINVLLILLVSMIVPGFTINGFLWALLFGIVLWIVSAVLDSFVK